MLSDGTCGTHSIFQAPFQTTLMFLFSEINLESIQQGQEYCPWCVGEHQPVRHCVVGVLSTRCHDVTNFDAFATSLFSHMKLSCASIHLRFPFIYVL